jgi:hypothetical protein
MKWWVLFLNDMRFPKYEMLTPVARADTKEDLVAYLDRERVEKYVDGRWGKTFRRGGPLEWYNHPYEFAADDHFVLVDLEARLERMRAELMEIPCVS